jgi:hypothetical protein
MCLTPPREDEFELSFVYGAESTNADVHARSIAPLLHKLVEGYNASVLLLGATGSGKTTALEGSGCRRDGRGGGATSSKATIATANSTSSSSGADGDGLVHLAADELFELLHAKAVLVGEAVARKRRVPSAKGFDFFVEASYVELHNEEARDLLARGAGAAAALPVSS